MQATLQVENKVQTNDWSKRVNLSIFSMIFVDTFLVCNYCTKSTETQKDFYSHLANDLIDNNYDSVCARRSPANPSSESPFGMALPRSGASTHLTPTKDMRKHKGGEVTKCKLQMV